MRETLPPTPRYSAMLSNLSILLYIFWLMLPAVQTTGRALTGCLAVGLFALGLALDGAYLRKHWFSLCLRGLCAALFPLALFFFLERGGAHFWGFYVQGTMLWFPLIFCAYARERSDPRLWRHVKPFLLCAMALTTLTTIGWLVQGMLRGGRIYAYSRSLGNAEPGREAYLKELMLRNIGGYDFIYATVVSLPLTCLGIQACSGWKRAGLSAFLCAQAIMVVLSQYTYAMVFAAGILLVEALGALLRKLFRLKLGPSLLLGALPLGFLLLFSVPLTSAAASLCQTLGFSNFSHSLTMLLNALKGGGGDAGRLTLYLNALEGFLRSPLIGSMLFGEKLLSQHSDLMDLLSGMGLLGGAFMGGMIWLMGRGMLKGLKNCAYRAQLGVMALILVATATLGTVVYSRDILLVAAIGTMLTLEGSLSLGQAEPS